MQVAQWPAPCVLAPCRKAGLLFVQARDGVFELCDVVASEGPKVALQGRQGDVVHLQLALPEHLDFQLALMHLT